MSVFMKILNILLLLAILPSILNACPISKEDALSGGRCVDVGGYQIYAKIAGQTDKPVVILDIGLGGDMSTWTTVVDQISKFARVIIYDRAGYGKSQRHPGTGPLTSEDSVNTLKVLLTKLNIKPPYFLIGHSLGGLNMQLFAQKYPKDIAGVVLSESSSRNQKFYDPLPGKDEFYYREALGLDQSRFQVKNAGDFPSVPLIVLTATDRGVMPSQEKEWQSWQKELVRLSPKGIQFYAWGSNHLIQKKQPQLIVDAVATLILGYGKN